MELSELLFAWGDLLYFSVAEGTGKIAGFWFPSGDQYPGWHFEDANKPQTSMSKYIEKKAKVVLKEQLLWLWNSHVENISFYIVV